MCIFSKEALAQETIIASGYRHIAYQNKVSIAQDTVMLMPIPGTNVNFLKLKKKALSKLAKQWIKATGWTKSTIATDSFPSPTFTSEVVGQYTVHYTQDPRSALIELVQPVYPWMDLIEDRYKGWSFVLVEMKAGQSISNQPWFVSFDPLYTNYLFVPMLDIHGDQFVFKAADRNHLILLQTNTSNTFKYRGNIDQWQGQWDGIEIGYQTSMQWANGDLVSNAEHKITVWEV